MNNTLPISLSILIGVVFCLVSSCATSNQPSNHNTETGLLRNAQTLSCSNADWSLTTKANFTEHKCIMDVQYSNGSTTVNFPIELERRDSPFTSTNAGVKTSKSGYYNPSHQFSDSQGRIWRVTFQNSQTNFYTPQSLDNYLNWEVIKKHHPVINKKGHLVTAMFHPSNDAQSFDLNISLTVIEMSQSTKALTELIEPKGKITIQ